MSLIFEEIVNLNRVWLCFGKPLKLKIRLNEKWDRSKGSYTDVLPNEQKLVGKTIKIFFMTVYLKRNDIDNNRTKPSLIFYVFLYVHCHCVNDKMLIAPDGSNIENVTNMFVFNVFDLAAPTISFTC